MKRTNEGSTCWLTITFKNKAGEEEAPASFEYRVDSAGGTELRDWATVSGPNAEHELTLTPDDNQIVDSGEDFTTDSTGSYQTNIVTVSANFGSDDKQNDEYKYQVRDLGQIPKEA